MAKVIIYQVLPRLFGNTNTTRVVAGTREQNGTGSFAAFDSGTLRRLRQLGATHVWYTGILRHATTTAFTDIGLSPQHTAVVKGKAGSPYAIVDYYDVDPSLAVVPSRRMREFQHLVQRTHAAGMGVIIDFVPNHVSRQYHSLCRPAGVRDLGADDDKAKHFSPTNDFYYCPNTPFVSPQGGDYHEYPARATGNDCFSASPTSSDWYETAKLNYGVDYNDWAGSPSQHFSPRPPLWDKMVDILLFWAATTGIDGFRCDMAGMVPTAFWQYAIAQVKAQFPTVLFLGEIYDKGQYRPYLSAGFDYLYDKVGMYDTLRGVITGALPTSQITQAWQSVDDCKDHMLYFLENHDEQRIASSFFAGDGQRGIPAVLVAALMGQNPFLLYAGQEFGEEGMDEEGFSGKDGRTTIFDYWCVDTLRRGYFSRREMTAKQRALERQYRQILTLARDNEAFQSGAFFDLMYVNEHLSPHTYAFLRGANALVVAHFGDAPTTVSLTLPSHAFDCLHISEGAVSAVDLLTGTPYLLSLRREGTLTFPVAANNGLVIVW